MLNFTTYLKERFVIFKNLSDIFSYILPRPTELGLHRKGSVGNRKNNKKLQQTRLRCILFEEEEFAQTPSSNGGGGGVLWVLS